MNVKAAALGTWILFLAPAVAAGAEAFAVLPASPAPGPDTALVTLAGEVRTAVQAREVDALGAEALRDRMKGNPPAAALAAGDAAYQAALDQHARGDFEGSIRTLRALVADLERLPGGAVVHSQWQRATLRLARSEQAVGRRGEAQAVLQRLLIVEPSLEVDPRLYPPGFQRLVEEARAETRALWTRRLLVEAQEGVAVFLEGREVGPAPATLDLPPGRYRISGALDGIHSREVLVDLTTEDRRVELDLSLAGCLRPEGGPGLAMPEAERIARTLAVARFLDLDRVVVVWSGSDAGAPYLAASVHDARRGTSSQEVRVALAEGRLPSGAGDALAAYLLTGEASPLVRVMPVPDLRPTLPPLDAPRPGRFSWDGVKRPEARKYGWIAVGSAVAAATLAAVSVSQLNAADGAYGDARAMLDPSGQVAYGHTVAEYNAAVRQGDRARSIGTVAAFGAGAFAVTSLVTGIVSYHRTGEIGPLRF
jgi:hypothetical protein